MPIRSWKNIVIAALMKLARPAPLSKVVRTICLPSPEEDFAEGQCVTSGWGRYGPSPALSTALLEANVPLLNLEECSQAYSTSVSIRKGHLCAGHTDGSTGSCVVNAILQQTFFLTSSFFDDYVSEGDSFYLSRELVWSRITHDRNRTCCR